MAIALTLERYLDAKNVKYDVIAHAPTNSSLETAATCRIPGDRLAKGVLLRDEVGYALAVLPATHNVDLTDLRQQLGVEQIRMAREDEMGQLFPDCEPGAIPPFGSMYNLPTLVDESLAEDEYIVFEGNTHEDAIRMAYRDFEELEHPRKARFAYHV